MGSPYVPFYTSDFLAGTGGMTASTKGVYITILCLIYEAEGPLPHQWESLARRCGCTLPAFKRAIEALVADGKVTIVDGLIWSPKVEKHLAQRGERRSSAEAAAKTRWQKDKEKQGKSDATASFPQCQPEPEPYRETTNVVSKPRKRGHRLPPDWTLPDDLREWAELQGWPPPVIEAEAEKMRDWSQNARTGAKIDWFAAWRNWMRDKPKVVAINGGWHGQRSHEPHRLQRIVTAAAAGTSGKGWG